MSSLLPATVGNTCSPLLLAISVDSSLAGRGRMLTRRVTLLALMAFTIVGAAAVAFMPDQRAQSSANETTSIGGPFELVDTNGKTITRDDVLGRPHAIFFGYTFCPDICPTTLFEMSGHLAAMGDEGDKLDVYFISVDAERDTPQHLAQYLKAFDPRIRGLSGSWDNIDQAVNGYKVAYKVHPKDTNGYYLIDHTASVLLFDARGHFKGTIGYGDDGDTARAKLQHLAAGA